MYSVSICAILKDERFDYLKEWILYHILIGVDHFYLYDNESARPVLNDIRRMGLEKIVDVLPWPGIKKQLAAYAHCLEQHGADSTWMAFIDLDEFIVIKNHPTIQLLLSDYMDYAGLALNWAYFGTSGHEKRPNGLQIENYVQRYPLAHQVNRHIKSIIRPEFVLGPATPHHFVYAPGNFCVNEAHYPVVGPFFPASWDLGQVNHYFFRSRQDFAEKIARGRAHSPNTPLQSNLLADQSGIRPEKDTSAQKFLPRLKLMFRQDNSKMALNIAFAGQNKTIDHFLAEAVGVIGKMETGKAMEIIRTGEVYFPDSLELKILGYTLARMTKDENLARKFINRGLKTGAWPELCYELLKIFSGKGYPEKAGACAAYIKRYLDDHGQGDSELASLVKPHVHDFRTDKPK